MQPEPPKEPIKYVESTLYLPYRYVAGDNRARFMRGLKDKTFIGSKCSQTGKVFVTPMVNSPESFAPCTEFVGLAGRGVVTTFCIVNIPVIGRDLQLPYVAASVALDGADISIFGAVQECKPEDVRMGMRVEAVWKPRDEWGFGIDNIEYFRPTGEPDAEYDTYKHHL
jgi:uncharacterized OB-fold protein